MNIDLESIKLLTKKDMYELDKMVKRKEKFFTSLTYDRVFKCIFYENEIVLKKFTIELARLDIDAYNSEIRILNTELPISNNEEKRSIVDITFVLNNFYYIDIEVNRNYYKYVKERNLVYAYKMKTIYYRVPISTKKSNEYMIQINLNAINDDNEYNDEFVLFGKKSCKKLTNDFIIFAYSLETYRELYYNGIDKSYSAIWLTILTSRNYVELYELLGQVLTKKERNSFIESVIKMNDNEVLFTREERMRLDEYEKQCIINGMYFDGVEKGTNDMIVNMLNKNMDIKLISEVSGKTIEEINEIKKNLVDNK